MQEKWKELQVILEEMKTIKKREYFLQFAVGYVTLWVYRIEALCYVRMSA